jgi:ribosomal protein L36
MKIQTSIAKRNLKKGERIVKRKGRLFRISPVPRRKARQG